MMRQSVSDRRFFMTAREDIGPRIKAGDHVCIDPDRAPSPGKYVLVDGRLELWSGQERRRGVATSTQRDIEGTVVGRFTDEDGPSDA